MGNRSAAAGGGGGGVILRDTLTRETAGVGDPNIIGANLNNRIKDFFAPERIYGVNNPDLGPAIGSHTSVVTQMLRRGFEANGSVSVSTRTYPTRTYTNRNQAGKAVLTTIRSRGMTAQVLTEAVTGRGTVTTVSVWGRRRPISSEPAVRGQTQNGIFRDAGRRFVDVLAAPPAGKTKKGGK